MFEPGDIVVTDPHGQLQNFYRLEVISTYIVGEPGGDYSARMDVNIIDCFNSKMVGKQERQFCQVYFIMETKAVKVDELTRNLIYALDQLELCLKKEIL